MSRSMTVMGLGALAAVGLLAGACEGKRDPEPLPGGGAHEVTSLTIGARPAEAKVGEPVRLTVTAVWAIPYVEDAAGRATYKVVDADMGEMTEPGVFVPAKAGTVRIVASYEGASASIDLVVKE